MSDATFDMLIILVLGPLVIYGIYRIIKSAIDENKRHEEILRKVEVEHEVKKRVDEELKKRGY